MVWLRLMPILMPIAVIVFAFVAKEPVWKKLIVVILYIALSVAYFVIPNSTITVIIYFSQAILFIILLIYYRNRGVI